MLGRDNMASKICGIYKITNTVNDKFYVGSSKDIKSRWCQHENALDSGTHGNPHLQNAWNKYGRKSFKFEIVEECVPEVQFEREQFYLNVLNPFDDNGYNIVRQISKEYMSDHYMVKKCDRCGHDYNTFSHRSKYCEKCKEEMKEENREWWRTWVPSSITDKDVMMWGYDGWDDFWESNI